MAISAQHYETVTGDSTPEGFEDREARVVERLSEMLNRAIADEETLPLGLQDAIAWGVHASVNPAQAPIGNGLTSMDVAGEYRVAVADGTSFGVDGQPMPSRWAFASDLGGRCVTMALRYRRIPVGF